MDKKFPEQQHEKKEKESKKQDRNKKRRTSDLAKPQLQTSATAPPFIYTASYLRGLG